MKVGGRPASAPLPLKLFCIKGTICGERHSLVKKNVLSGLDQIETFWPRDLKGARVGLVVHPASIDQAPARDRELLEDKSSG
jgi:uncharacterized protein YbbC (DUF1343 family)